MATWTTIEHLDRKPPSSGIDTRDIFLREGKKKQSWAAKKIQTWALQSEDLIWPFVFSLAIFLTPLKINMEPKHHAIEQENHLPTLHDFGLQPLIFQLVSNFKIWSMPWNDVLFFPSPNIAPEKIGLRRLTSFGKSYFQGRIVSFTEYRDIKKIKGSHFKHTLCIVTGLKKRGGG